jgi:hypothetical protein
MRIPVASAWVKNRAHRDQSAFFSCQTSREGPRRHGTSAHWRGHPCSVPRLRSILTSPVASGRRRPHQPAERGPVVRVPPHPRPRQTPHRHGHPHRGGMGHPTRLLRPLPHPGAARRPPTPESRRALLGDAWLPMGLPHSIRTPSSWRAARRLGDPWCCCAGSVSCGHLQGGLWWVGRLVAARGGRHVGTGRNRDAMVGHTTRSAAASVRRSAARSSAAACKIE